MLSSGRKGVNRAELKETNQFGWPVKRRAARLKIVRLCKTSFVNEMRFL